MVRCKSEISRCALQKGNSARCAAVALHPSPIKAKRCIPLAKQAKPTPQVTPTPEGGPGSPPICAERVRRVSEGDYASLSVLACTIDAGRNTWRNEASEKIGSAKRVIGLTIPQRVAAETGRKRGKNDAERARERERVNRR